jgi:glycine cleavage system H protein
MMDFPEELKYSKEHFWVRVEGNRAVIGITDYAQSELGSVTSVELPDAGYELEQDDSFGSIEARKTVADLYAPIGGTVLSINDELHDAPELVNDDPYDGGWFVEVELADREELNLLMNSDDYQDYVAESE